MDGQLKDKSEEELKELLAKCVKFEERKRIRNAIREVQGLNGNSIGGVQPLSFRPRNVKSVSSLSQKLKTAENDSETCVNVFCTESSDNRNGIVKCLNETKCSDNHILLPNTSITLSDECQKISGDTKFSFSILNTDNSEGSKLNQADCSSECLESTGVQNSSSFIEKTSPCDQNLNVISKNRFDSTEVTDNSHKCDSNNSNHSDLKENSVDATIRRKRVCTFFSFGKITSNIPNSAITSPRQTAKTSTNMESQTKSFRSQLVIGSIGNPKTANFNDVFSHHDDQDNKLSGSPVKRTHSLKVLKNNQFYGQTQGQHDGGTVITDEIRRKSLEQNSMNYGKDGGTVITEEMRRKSLSIVTSENNVQNFIIDNRKVSSSEINGNSIDVDQEPNNTSCLKSETNTDNSIDRQKMDSPCYESESHCRTNNTIVNVYDVDNRNISSNCSQLMSNDQSSLEENSENSEENKLFNIDQVQDDFRRNLNDFNAAEGSANGQNENLNRGNRITDTVRSDSMEEECSDCLRDQESNQEGSVEFLTEGEFTQQLQALQTQLKECSDFTKRRKIRGRIRKLREQYEAFETRRKPVAHQFVENCTRANGVSREVTQSQQYYNQVDSKDELRKLLTQTNDYEEKKQIRLALRQLRQRDREREGGGRSGPTSALTRSQSIISSDRQSNNSSRPRAVRCSSVVETSQDVDSQIREPLLENSYCNGHDSGESHVTRDSVGSFSDNHSTKHDNSPNSPTSPLRRSFSLNSVQRKKSSGNSRSNSVQASVRSNSPHSCSSSSDFSERSKDSVHSNSKSSYSSDLLEHSKDVPNGKSSKYVPNGIKSQEITNQDVLRRKSVPSSAKHFRESDDSKSGSESDSSSCRDWLEKKRRNSLTVIDTKKLNSTMDIEAAFSEILNAVDTEEENNNDDSPELEILQVDGEEKIDIKTPRVVPTITSSVDINFNKRDVKPEINENDNNRTKRSKEEAAAEEQIKPTKQSTELQLTPKKKDRPTFTLAPVTPKNDSLSVIEDDDGSITVQSVSYKDQGDCTVTEKTTLRRSASRAEEEEKDTVIESKVTSPGGSDHYEKDVIKTKRKLTSRGSDYFSRSQYSSKWRRNKEGETIEEHDVTMESDNYSVTKGQSWGDRSEANVMLNKPSLVGGVTGVKELTNHDAGDKRLQVPGKMDVSKASSGYGSVSGSDEEEALAKDLQGRPSGSPEVKAPLKDLITLEGSNAVLECIVACSPQPDITWYKADKSVMNNRHFESKYDTVSGRAILTVLSSKKEDCGQYRCVCRNPLGEAETKAVLTVRSKAKKKPQFTKPLKNMVATEGHSVCLECAVNDAMQVSWYKDGIIQRNTSDFKQTFDGLNAKLEIDEIFVDDHGEYACVAKNDFGENKTTCKINVKETACETDVVPMFLNKPESKILECNDTITLQCDVIGSPQPTITWTKDQQTVASDNHHKQTFDGRTALLLITKAAIEDSGKYECVAENKLGKITVDALIVVKAKQACPEVLCPLTDKTAVYGKSLTLQCEVKGNPSPMIVWRKDSRIIGNTKDFRQTYQDIVAKLQISDVHKEDSGCYECVARNVHGAVTTKCSVTVEGSNTASVGAESKTKKSLDWLVGRDNNTPVAEDTRQKSSSIKRSETMKVTSNYSLRDKYRRATQADNAVSETTNDSPAKPLVVKETEQKQESVDKVDINMNKTKFEDPLKQKTLNKTKGSEDPPWKNVTLRRTESARLTGGRRESPFLRKRKEELADKLDVATPSQNTEDPSKLVTKPPGWRPVIGDRKEQDAVTGSEVLSALRQINLRRSDSARTLRDENRQTCSNVGTKNNDRDEGSKIEIQNSVEDDTPKIGQTSSTRLLFERKLEESAADKAKASPLSNFLNRPGAGLRRTSSLKVTASERDSGTRPVVHSRLSGGIDLDHSKEDSEKSLTCSESESESEVTDEGGRPVNNRFHTKEGDQNTAMPTYDNIDDEDELHKILSKTDDFDERKKIRNRMRELREKKSKELEAKRLQREKETEDIFKKKFAAAEQEQKRQMQAFEKAAQQTKEEREKILNVKDDIIKEHLAEAEAAKKRQLAAFDKIAQKGGEGVVSSKAGFGGQAYTKTPEQAAKFLSDKLINAGSPVVGGKITVRTETWNSQDGVTNKSEKTESWGAQPAGAQGALNKFKAMEPAGAGGAKPNFAAAGRGAGRGGGRGGGRVMRSPSAIKEMLLNWTKAMTAGYENVEVTNFSTSWNDGMAFCALIHHFYPESFDFAKLDPKKRRANFTLAFNVAEKYADIAPLLDVDDMVKMQKPDWKCVFTYVQSFYRKLNDHPNNKGPKPEQ